MIKLVLLQFKWYLADVSPVLLCDLYVFDKKKNITVKLPYSSFK